MGLRWDLGQTARPALWDRLDDDEPPRVYLKLHPDDLKALQKELEALLSRNMKGDMAFLDLPTGQVLRPARYCRSWSRTTGSASP